jgi:hypothetical protein
MTVPAFADLSDLAKKAILVEGHGDARLSPELDCSATSDAAGVTVFLSNRLLSEPLTVAVAGLPAAATGRLRWLSADSPWSRNDEGRPDAVGFRQCAVETNRAGVATVEIPPHTVAALAVDR